MCPRCGQVLDLCSGAEAQGMPLTDANISAIVRLLRRYALEIENGTIRAKGAMFASSGFSVELIPQLRLDEVVP